MVWFSFGRTVLKVCSYHPIQGRLWRALRIHEAACPCLQSCKIDPEGLILRRFAISMWSFLCARNLCFCNCCSCIEACFAKTLGNRNEVLGQQASFMMKAQDETEVPEKCNCNLLPWLSLRQGCQNESSLVHAMSTAIVNGDEFAACLQQRMNCDHLFPAQGFGIFSLQIDLHRKSM